MSKTGRAFEEHQEREQEQAAQEADAAWDDFRHKYACVLLIAHGVVQMPEEQH